MTQWLEQALSLVAPPKLGRLSEPQEFYIEDTDPFASEITEDGVGQVKIRKYRDAIERVNVEGV
jgi:hypothetical protein